MTNNQKEFHAPPGFDIANVELAPEKKDFIDKIRGRVSQLFSRKN